MAATTYVHSNAFNFLGFVQAGVDPRTGQYSCSIALPELKANHLCGPVFPLKLVFSALNTTDSGFGKGWSLQLSQYDPVSKILSLSTGETFKIEGTTTHPTVPERKLDSFHFAIESDEKFRVTHKSGLVEVLEVKVGDTVALPSEVHSVEGHKITLLYTQYKGGLALASISDDYGPLLRIDRSSPIMFHVQVFPDRGPGNTPLANFVLDIGTDDWLNDIHLPTDNQASWHFDYLPINGLLCISELTTPVGGVEKITYASQGHQFPGNTRDPLPRVCTHVREPGFGQPPIKMCYDFSTRNFLGFAAVGLIWTDDGLDNLYRAKSDYEYDSTETLYDGATPVRVTYRKFNNFHLLIEETVTQNDNVNTTRTTYHGIPGATFEQQPAQCQLPKQVSAIWYRKSASSQTHEELTLTTFDTFGNLLEQSNPDGTVETSRYFPAEGGPGCPADPQGFVRTLQDKTITPAPWDNDKPDTDPAPVLRSLYTYALQTGVGGGTTPGWLAMTSETLLQVKDKADPIDQGTELKRTTLTYIDKPADRYLHGRKLQDKQTINGKSIITDYTYSTGTNARAGQTVQHTVVTLSSDFDAVQKTFTLQHSLLNGQPLLNRDDQDVEIAYSYDALGRVLTETVAPDTEFEACRSYEYWLSTRAGQQAEQVVTDVSGIKVRSKFDGMNRVIEEQRQNADSSTRADVMRQTYQATYNGLGQLVNEVEFDWLQDKQLALESSYQYDDWGERSSVTDPNGMVNHSEQNPITRITTTWAQGQGKTKTLNNLFDKPVSVERLDLDDKRVSFAKNTYDGLGRLVAEYDALGNERQSSYDAFDRIISQTLADGAQVETTYALHSDKSLPTSIAVGGVVLGTQTYDSLDRLVKSTTGGRERTFDFVGGQLQPCTVHTASGQDIKYEYQPELGEQPTRRSVLNSTADYSYDPKTARLLTSKEQSQALERKYFSTGDLKSETRKQGGGAYSMEYEYSRQGRLLSYTDVAKLNQTYAYDTGGRLEHTVLGDVSSQFSYNTQGQLQGVTCNDTATGHSLQTTLQYDDLGRETLRTFMLAKSEYQQLSQAYDAADRLTNRTLSQSDSVLRDETFEYDSRGRLDTYSVSGPSAPLDPQGKQIQAQTFSFDALNNLQEVKTTFAGGSNTAKYEYKRADPVQLSALTNDHPDYPARLTFSYDADGNLSQDEQGRALSYDALGRLNSVGASGLAYDYDAQDSLTGTRNGSVNEQRFYCEGEVVTRLIGAAQSRFIRGYTMLLAEQNTGQSAANNLLLTDARKTVLAEQIAEVINDMDYTAYGHRTADVATTHAGFNGELVEADTGWYLLGNGYRAYNPVLMRFHSPDSLSPFGEGGLNAYAYCAGDPVNYRDPTGHAINWGAWAGIGLSVLGIVATVASAGALAPLGIASIASGVLGVASATTSLAMPESKVGDILGYASVALGVLNAGLGASSLAKSGAGKRIGSLFSRASRSGPRGEVVGAEMRNPTSFDFSMRTSILQYDSVSGKVHIGVVLKHEFPEVKRLLAQGKEVSRLAREGQTAAWGSHEHARIHYRYIKAQDKFLATVYSLKEPLPSYHKVTGVAELRASLV